MISNRIRFSGMASGMDTDSIVKDMMRPQQYKIDMQKKEQALVQLRQDAWKDMNKKLYDFHTKFTHKLSLASTFDKGVVTSSNENAISIASGETVPKGTHTFEVTRLAKSATAVGKIAEGMPKDSTIGVLMKGEAEETPEVPKELIMSVNGVKIKVAVNSGNTLSEIANAMNKQLKGEGKEDSDNKVDTGFVASYDEKNGSFFVNSTLTGESQTIDFAPEVLQDPADPSSPKIIQSPNSVALFKKMGLIKEKDGEFETLVTGKDAVYTYNDVPGFKSATNKIEINGVKVTLKTETAGPVTISSVTDPDVTYAFVKEFVTEYNKLLDEINQKIGTKPGKNIQPLTAEERKAMSESDIKLWEDKLNSSLFYKDEQLTNFVNSARSILNGAIGGKTLASIGIVTGPWDEKGKLHIEGDEDDTLYAGRTNKLKAEIEKDPQAVKDLLLGLGKKLYEDHNKTLTTSSKLKSAMNFYNDKLMADKVKTFDKQILTLEDRMYKMEETQYRKFAAMEKMLSSLNSQGSWLSQQFGG